MPTRPRSREGCRERRKSFPEHLFFLRHREGPWASGSPARKPLPHIGVKGPASAINGEPELNRCWFMAGFCMKWAKSTSEDGVFSNVVPDSAVEIMHASTKAHVLEWV